MRRTVILSQIRARQRVATGFVLAAGCLPAAQAQERFYVEAYDRQNGAVITDLRPVEVTVREDGEPREVVEVRLANLPLKLTIVLDNGPATATAFDLVKDGLRVFIEGLPWGQDLSLLALAPEPRWLVQGTLDAAELLAAIDAVTVEREGSARLLDGMAVATEWLGTEAELKRPVLVTIAADGPDPSRDVLETFETVVDGMRRHGVTSHTVIMWTPRMGSLVRRATPAEALGGDLATFTGGTYARVALGSSLDEPLGRVAATIDARNRELSRQHLIRYDRHESSAPGELKVQINRLGARYSVSWDGRLQSGR